MSLCDGRRPAGAACTPEVAPYITGSVSVRCISLCLAHGRSGPTGSDWDCVPRCYAGVMAMTSSCFAMFRRDVMKYAIDDVIMFVYLCLSVYVREDNVLTSQYITYT